MAELVTKRVAVTVPMGLLAEVIKGLEKGVRVKACESLMAVVVMASKVVKVAECCIGGSLSNHQTLCT